VSRIICRHQRSGGTQSSNPVPSCNESCANLTSFSIQRRAQSFLVWRFFVRRATLGTPVIGPGMAANMQRRGLHSRLLATILRRMGLGGWPLELGNTGRGRVGHAARPFRKSRLLPGLRQLLRRGFCSAALSDEIGFEHPLGWAAPGAVLEPAPRDPDHATVSPISTPNSPRLPLGIPAGGLGEGRLGNSPPSVILSPHDRKRTPPREAK
jgi:hypothetical protein